MKKIKSCSLFKGVCVGENLGIISVAKSFHDFQERRIFVLDKKKYPVGIISIVDINDRVVAKGLDLKKTKAKDIMSYPIKLIADFEDDLKDIASKMVELDVYYVPVISKGIFKGILTYANLVKSIGGK